MNHKSSPLLDVFPKADGCCSNMIKPITSKFEEESLHIFSEYSHVCHKRLQFPFSFNCQFKKHFQPIHKY